MAARDEAHRLSNAKTNAKERHRETARSALHQMKTPCEPGTDRRHRLETRRPPTDHSGKKWEGNLRARFISKRDFIAGGLMTTIGLSFAWVGRTYGFGTTMRPGPGFMPTALGVVLAILGLVITIGALNATEDQAEESILPANPSWRGWACILGGILAFMIFGKIGGLLPAAFSCVFISASGDRAATLKGSLLLAAAITLFGALLFSVVLQMPIPLLQWSPS